MAAFHAAPHAGSRAPKTTDAWTTLVERLERTFPSVKKFLSWQPDFERAGPVFYIPEMCCTDSSDFERSAPVIQTPVSAASAA